MSICSTTSGCEAPLATVSANGIEVDDQQLERLDAQLRDRAGVLGVVLVGEQPGVHVGVEGLHPPAEDLREAGDLVDRGHRHAEVADPGGGRAGGDDLDAGLVQPLRELVEPRLVVDADERAADGDPGHRVSSARGRLWAEAAAERADGADVERLLGGLDAGAQGVLVVAGLDRHLGLRDHRAGVDALVHPVDGDPGGADAGGEGVADGVGAGEGRQQRRVGVDDAEPGDDTGVEDAHEPREHHEVRPVAGEAPFQRPVPVRSARVGVQRLGEGLDPGARRAVRTAPQPGRSVPTATT